MVLTLHLLITMAYTVSTRSGTKQLSLTRTEWRFRKACDQLVHLNLQLSEIQKRHKDAKDRNVKPLLYTLCLRLAVIEGVRNMYYEYVYCKANEIADMRQQLYGENVIIRSGSVSNMEDDSDSDL